MKTHSQAIIENIYEKETPLKQLAEKATRDLFIPETFPGGTRIFAPRMQGTIWGEPCQMTMSVLKTDVFDRRFITRKPITVDEVVRGAFSKANRAIDDMPYRGLVRAVWGALVEEGGRRDIQIWSEMYPFPCIKPVGQIIVRADDLEGGKRLVGKQSMSNGAARVHTEGEDGKSIALEYLVGMQRNIIAVKATYGNLKQPLSFRLYRHQDQGHRRYMDEHGSYIPAQERRVVFTPADPTAPVEYYDLEADADINGPFEPPKMGADGRFFWVSQRFPAEPTFPDGFEYVMMGTVSNTDAAIRESDLQKSLGANPHIPVDSTGKIIVEKEMERYSYMLERMQRSYELFRDAPGTAVEAAYSEPGTGSTELYVAIVTSNETEDIYAEAKRQLLEAEKMGHEGLANENKDWYDALYDRREEGRIVVAATGDVKGAVNELIIDDAFRSWGISDGGFCDPDPRKYEGCEVYAGFDMDAQSWHSLPCYNEVFSEPMMVQNRHEPYLYYCRLVEAWYEGLKGRAREIYNLPGMVMPHGYLPPARPNPLYIENQTFDLCLEVSGQVLKSLWNMWDYRADDEMFRNLIYPAIRDLAIFYEAFARRNYDGSYFNLLPVVESENWGISYELKHTKNTTAAITLVRKILHCAIEGAELLEKDEDRIPGWREVAENLPPYPKFMVSSGEILGGNPGGIPRWTSGDHPIYTGDFPATLADEITLDSRQDEKELIARTNDIIRTEGNWNLNAFILVGKYRDHVPCTLSTPSILIDNNVILTGEILIRPERLLNSRSGRIHLFPVLPDWPEVAFRDFQARGGFIVSAAIDKDGVKAVLIRARRSIPCRVMNPWAGKATLKNGIVVTDVETGDALDYTVNRDNGECIVFNAVAGHEYSIDLQ